jgi:hypothetical protein
MNVHSSRCPELESIDSRVVCKTVSPERRTAMPALLIPVLWVGGAAVLLGGGYYLVHVMH